MPGSQPKPVPDIPFQVFAATGCVPITSYKPQVQRLGMAGLDSVHHVSSPTHRRRPHKIFAF